MKNSKKLLALGLVIVSILAIALPAMAGVSTLAKGQTKYKSYTDLTKAPSYNVSLTTYTQYNDKCTVILSLNDLTDGGTWKVSATKLLV